MYTVGALFEIPSSAPQEPGERVLLCNVLPPWQRPEVWSPDQKRRFIESMLLGFPPGYYVKNGSDWGKNGQPLRGSGWLLDGQQRIAAIRDFVQNDLVVFEDQTYRGLSASAARDFLRMSFPCVEIDYCADERLLQELYDRLNFGGTPHASDQRAVPPAPAAAPLVMREI